MSPLHLAATDARAECVAALLDDGARTEPKSRVRRAPCTHSVHDATRAPMSKPTFIWRPSGRRLRGCRVADATLFVRDSSQAAARRALKKRKGNA